MTTALGTEVREYEWRIAQGTQQRLLVPILDEDGDPYPVDGWVVDAKIKAAPLGQVLYTWPDEDVSIDGPTVTLLLPGPVSEPWTWLAGWYRVKLIDPDSSPANPTIARILQGSFLVDPD